MKRIWIVILLGLAGVSCAPAAPAAPIPAKIRIGFQPVMPMTPFFVAEAQGWWKELGVPVEEIKFTSGPPMIQAFAAGEIDAAYIGTTPAAVAVARGVPVKSVVNAASGGMAIAMTRELAALYQAQGGARAIGTLRAKLGRKLKIATLPKGSAPDAMLRFWISQQLQLNPETDVEITPMGEEQLRQALVANQVEVATLMEPFATMVGKQNLAYDLALWSDSYLPGVPGTALVLRTELIQKYPALAKKIVEIDLRATRSIKADPDNAARAVSQFLGAEVLPVEIARAALASPGGGFVANPHRGMEALLAFNSYAVKIEILPREVSAADLYDVSLYDAVVKEKPDLAD